MGEVGWAVWWGVCILIVALAVFFNAVDDEPIDHAEHDPFGSGAGCMFALMIVLSIIAAVVGFGLSLVGGFTYPWWYALAFLVCPAGAWGLGMVAGVISCEVRLRDQKRRLARYRASQK